MQATSELYEQTHLLPYEWDLDFPEFVFTNILLYSVLVTYGCVDAPVCSSLQFHPFSDSFWCRATV